jgi:hypothetical protein
MYRLLLAASFAIIATTASAADYGCQRVKFKCLGFEPGFIFRPSGGGHIKFTDPENPNSGRPPMVIAACATQLSGTQTSITTGPPLALSATVTQQSCDDPNSGTTRAYFIAISYMQGAAGNTPHQVSGTGCCHK